MTVHQFRHLCAAIALDAHPGNLGLVRDLLGHKNIKTTANFYAGMRTREAAREYDRILERSRSTGDREDGHDAEGAAATA
jgi:integrase